MNIEAKKRLIVALDILEEEKCIAMVDLLSPEVDIFKVGVAPFTGFGQNLLRKLRDAGKKVFLDLKFHDIPNTVKNAVYTAAKQDVFMMNVHCLGGRKMLEAAAEGAKKGAEEKGGKKPLLLGVTVLTSMKEEDMREVGLEGTAEDKVTRFARMARDAGLDGVVASAEETKAVKELFGDGFIVVAPGIRPVWAAAGDQKRIVTPKEAIENGADYIVVGRPIIQAEDPLDAAKRIIGEMEEG